MNFLKKVNWFWVAMVLSGYILSQQFVTVVPHLTPLERTHQRMNSISSHILFFVEDHGKVPEDLHFIEEILHNHSFLLDGWGTPIQYTVTNNVVSLTCHIKGNENEILIRRFSIEKAIVKGEEMQ